MSLSALWLLCFTQRWVRRGSYYLTVFRGMPVKRSALGFLVLEFFACWLRHSSRLISLAAAGYFSRYPVRSVVSDRVDVLEFENLFKDSGYWDYFLLALYDTYFRLYGVYTLFFVSDFSIVEKASWRGMASFLWPLNQVFFFELRTLGEFFLHVLCWCSLAFCGFVLLVTISLIFLA